MGPSGSEEYTDGIKLPHLLPAVVLGPIPEGTPFGQTIDHIRMFFLDGGREKLFGTSSDEWSCLHEHRRQEMQSRRCVRRRRGATRLVTSEAWCKPLFSTMILLGLYKSNPSAL